MPSVSISITGDKAVQAKLKSLGASLFRFDDSMRSIGEYLAAFYANEGFASQGQVFGSTWPTLSQKYSVWKAKNFPGAGPLIRTGDMKAGFQYQSGSQSVVIDNKVDYFKYHQLGGSKLPQRQMMGLNDKNIAMIRSILQDEVNQKIASA